MLADALLYLGLVLLLMLGMMALVAWMLAYGYRAASEHDDSGPRMPRPPRRDVEDRADGAPSVRADREDRA